MTKKRATRRLTAPRTTARTTVAVQGARVHNLKNISLEIPRDSLIVVTGLSGSGKSSLAFDTIYAEGSGATWSRCRATPSGSSPTWPSPTWTSCSACRR